MSHLRTITYTICDFCGKAINRIEEEYMLVQFRKKGIASFYSKAYCKSCFDYNRPDSLKKFKGIKKTNG